MEDEAVKQYASCCPPKADQRLLDIFSMFCHEILKQVQDDVVVVCILLNIVLEHTRVSRLAG